MIDYDKINEGLEKIVKEFEKSAPTVSNWANDLYIRLNTDVDSVKFIEIVNVARIVQEFSFFSATPSNAANTIYKLKNRLGQDTTGDFGF